MKIDIPREKDAIKFDFDDSMQLIRAEKEKKNRSCYKTVACIALLWFIAAVLGGLLTLTFVADQAEFVHYKFYLGSAYLVVGGVSLIAFGLAVFYLGLDNKPAKDDDVSMT